ncbi:MAG: hypothetical protein SCARUB_02231 [Candidatus Scalindua rubra]|uniref:Uncharacterized protein n=1 Tax=Candidatus Scalindua rubra TaxID=1872076 RepID=A0A1E3XAK0_9BACT|nr:MAG: hypothetical protein SCARUB_02231 [Candidatus Scalindua rubra]
MELIRSRWHISIAINALLDKDIEILKNEPSQDNLKFLLNLIKRRKLFALFLSDPIPYSFEGGTIGDINEVARNEFFLDHLKEMTYKKFEVVDRLYKDQMESIRISQFDTFEKEMQEMREKSKDYLDFLKKESKESARMP